MALRVIHPHQQLLPAAPLWRRVPTTDQAGENLSDFMVLIPGFKRWPLVRRECACRLLQGLLEARQEGVVFVDFNIELNLLWISHRPGRGRSLALFAAIRERIPEALLVASQAEAQRGLLDPLKRYAGRGRLGGAR